MKVGRVTRGRPSTFDLPRTPETDPFLELKTTTRLRGNNMESWADLLDDPAKVRSIYGDDVPSLDSVHLHEITLHRDGARLTLRFDLSKYPTDPPKKWQAQGFNT